MRQANSIAMQYNLVHPNSSREGAREEGSVCLVNAARSIVKFLRVERYSWLALSA